MDDEMLFVGAVVLNETKISENNLRQRLKSPAKSDFRAREQAGILLAKDQTTSIKRDILRRARNIISGEAIKNIPLNRARVSASFFTIHLACSKPTRRKKKDFVSKGTWLRVREMKIEQKGKRKKKKRGKKEKRKRNRGEGVQKDRIRRKELNNRDTAIPPWKTLAKEKSSERARSKDSRVTPVKLKPSRAKSERGKKEEEK